MQQILNVQDVLSIFIFNENDFSDMQYAVVPESILNVYILCEYIETLHLYILKKKKTHSVTI